MGKSFVMGRVRMAVGLLLLSIVAPRAAGNQPSGVYQTVPDAVAIYRYHAGEYYDVTLPLDAVVRFSGDNLTSTLTATFYKPIIGALADGTPLFPIGEVVP
jgi:hypothetical protein